MNSRFTNRRIMNGEVQKLLAILVLILRTKVKRRNFNILPFSWIVSCGYFAAACLRTYQFSEAGKEVERIVGAWSGFGMILNAEHRLFLVSQSLNGLVVQVDVCHFDER